MTLAGRTIVDKRMKRFELSTLSLARRCSTTELHPQLPLHIIQQEQMVQHAWQITASGNRLACRNEPALATIARVFGPALWPLPPASAGGDANPGSASSPAAGRSEVVLAAIDAEESRCRRSAGVK